jgi:predicted NUDIX family NTP pyrophosphohydrolase
VGVIVTKSCRQGSIWQDPYEMSCGRSPQAIADLCMSRTSKSRPSSGGVEISAGLLVFRRINELEVLLGHPGGPFWAKKDDGAWTIPKGLVEPSLVESGDDLIATARREFTEETNLTIDFANLGDTAALVPVKQRSGKVVHAFAITADLDLAPFASNTFEIEWPPKSGRRKSFPEIDRIAYFALPAAMTKIIAYQKPFLIELEQRLAQGSI